MAKNSGKPSESDFEDILSRLGKRAYCYRIVDAAEVRGRTGRIGFIRPAPSDYIVTIDGQTSYSEVKSTTDTSAFRFSLLRTKQSAAAVQIVAAGGDYFVYVHSLVQNRWYRIPYQTILGVKATGKASINWSDLQGYEWKLSSTT
jgi:penicillin-binding protein-related factor A (putative recombinase)